MVINDSRLWISQLISHSLNFGPMIFLWNVFAILQEIFEKKSPNFYLFIKSTIAYNMKDCLRFSTFTF
jgi:hypothetical protein